MKELVGKLSALDPEAGDALKVVTYFDTLMDGHVSIETLVRGAATLAGAPAGYLKGATSIRVLADGRRGSGGDPEGHVSASAGGATVWIEREGNAHANDDMVRERLAVAVAQYAGRGNEQTPERQAVELLLTAGIGSEERRGAEARLRLDPLGRVRAVALPSRAPATKEFPSTVLATPWGTVRGAILPEASEPPEGRAGVGVAGRVTELPYSWRTALVALAVADTDGASRADDLGSLISVADSINDSSELPDDVTRAEAAVGHGWTVATLQAVADGGSVRAVASIAGLHHSSVHSRLPELTRLLGFDPLTPLGRVRLFTALLLLRVAHAHFD